MVQANVKQPQVAQAMTGSVAIPKGIEKGLDIGKAIDYAKGLGLTPYELRTIVMSCIICALLLLARMYVHGQQLEIQQAVTEYTNQTHRLQTQTAIMENEIQMKRNYETIQQAAKDAGMTINRANVKEVSNGAE